MILTADAIDRGVRSGRIEIDPYEPSNLNPNSYDVRLGPKLLRYTDDTVDPKVRNETEEVPLPPGGLVLPAGSFQVGHIAEWIGTDHFVPLLHAKPEVAALGLFVHVTANLIDIGNRCNFSLHLHAARRVRLRVGMVVGEVSFWRVQGKIDLYRGKYLGMRGPAASRSYRHF